MHTANMRHYSRLPFLAEALIDTTEGPLPVQLLDISLKGALIALPEAAPPLHAPPFTLIIRLSDGDEIIAMQAVVRHQEHNHIGCEWVEIDIDSMTHLRRLLELNLADPSLVERELDQLHLP